MPAITLPERTGYTFGGYFTGEDGAGTKYYNADGSSATNSTFNSTSGTTLYAKWTADEYTITLDANDGTGGTGSVDATYDSSTLPAITNPTKAGYIFAGWYDGEKDGNGSGNLVINNSGELQANVAGYTGAGGIWTKAAETTLHAKWIAVEKVADECWDGSTYKCGNIENFDTPKPAGSTINWDEATWGGGDEPGIDTRVVVPDSTEIVIGTGVTAKAKEVNLSDGATLNIAAGGTLIINESLTKGGGATATGDLLLGSDASHGNAALVLGNYDGSTAVNASAEFYTLSHGTSGSSASVNQYVGIPFTSGTVLSCFYNSWVYKVNDAGTQWERITDGDESLSPFVGYNVISADATGHIFDMDGTLVPTTDRTLTLTYSGENVFANSWTAPIKISALAGAFTGAEATIYIFNAGSPDDHATYGAGTGANPGQYQTIPVSGSIPSGYEVIPSMQSFSVYSASGDTHTLTLDYSAVVYDPAVAGTASPMPNKAPRRASATDSERLIVNVTGESGWGDNVRLYAGEDFTTGFDNGYDGRKLFGWYEAPSLYAVTSDGQMAVNCVPDLAGTVMGFKAGTTGNEYTFSFEYDEADDLYLYDTYTDEYTRIANESSYTFTTSDESAHERFVLTRQAPKITTGVEAISHQPSAVRKLIIEDKLYLMYEGRMYDVQGQRVK